MSILGYPLGWIMWALYQVIPNYAVALILFTLVTRLILLPFAIKQQKSTVKMISFKPKLDEINAKYANNKQKQQEEMLKLYQEEGYNPMSGCLPLLIQFPILFGLIDVIYKPLTHIIRLPEEIIEKGIEIVTASGTVGYSPEIQIFNGVKQGLPEFDVLGADAIARISELNLTFLGLDLAQQPTWGWNVLILIPILSGVTSLLMSIVTMRTSAASQTEGGGQGMTKGMMYIMPIFSLIFAMQVPAGVGLYWVFSNIFAIIQSLVLNKLYNPAEMAAKAKAEAEERRERERLEKIEAKKKAKEGDAEAAEKALSAKEINRRKLAEARRRDAEKYGEKFVDVTDDDLL